MTRLAKGLLSKFKCKYIYIAIEIISREV